MADGVNWSKWWRVFDAVEGEDGDFRENGDEVLKKWLLERSQERLGTKDPVAICSEACARDLRAVASSGVRCRAKGEIEGLFCVGGGQMFVKREEEVLWTESVHSFQGILWEEETRMGLLFMERKRHILEIFDGGDVGRMVLALLAIRGAVCAGMARRKLALKGMERVTRDVSGNSLRQAAETAVISSILSPKAKTPLQAVRKLEKWLQEELEPPTDSRRPPLLFLLAGITIKPKSSPDSRKRWSSKK